MGGMSAGADGGKDAASRRRHERHVAFRRGMMKKMVCGFADHLEGRLAYLKAELKLTASRPAPGTTFAEAWRCRGAKGEAKMRRDRYARTIPSRKC